MQSLLNFWHTNKPLCLLLLHMALSAIVAVTPKIYQKKPIFGVILKILHFQSTLTHYDEGGSLQVPLVRKVLGVGRKMLEAAEKTLAPPDPPK